MIARHSRRNRILRLAAGAAVIASLAGIGSPHARADTITLRFASWDPAAITNIFINTCATKLGLHVQNEYIANTGAVSTYGTKISTEFAAGTAPDFFYGLEVNTLLWGKDGYLLDQIPWRKQLNAPVTNVLPEDLWWADGVPNTKLWGQSIASETVYIFYNKNAFKKAGVTAMPPTDVAHAWTWDQFVKVATQLTLDKNGKHPGDAGFDASHISQYGVRVDNIWYSLLPFIYGNGGALFDSANKHFLMNSPAATQAIQQYADLITKDHVAPTTAVAAAGTGITLASGHLAMYIVGNWNTYFDQAPNPAKAPYPMGIGVLPVMKTYKTLDLGGNIVVNAHTAHPKEAMEMAICISQNSKPLWQNGLWLPTVKNQYTPANYAAWANTPWHPANYKSVAVDTLQYAVPQPNVLVTQWGPAWNNYIAPAMDAVMSGHETAAAAMNGIAPQVNALLGQG